jgi:hypothetical protein
MKIYLFKPRPLLSNVGHISCPNPIKTTVFSNAVLIRNNVQKIIFFCKSVARVVNIGSGIDTDSIAVNDTQYRVSIGGTLKKGVSERYRSSIDRYSDSDTSSVVTVFGVQQKMTSRIFVWKTFF